MTFKSLLTSAFAMALCMLLSVSLSAQVDIGTFDLQYANETVDCSGTPTFCATVQISSAVGGESFAIGSYTVFINYNTASINNPVYTPINFSGGAYLPAQFSYDGSTGEGNLTTLMATPGTGSPTIDNNWTDIGTFCFDVVSDAETTDLGYDLGLTEFNKNDNTNVPSGHIQGVLSPLAVGPACPTCDDGIQNGDEEGIDCGGTSCAPCGICGQPSGLNLIEVTETTVQFEWDAVTGADNIQYGYLPPPYDKDVNPWVASNPNGSGSLTQTPVIPGLYPGIQYRAGVRARCSGEWSAPTIGNFTTDTSPGNPGGCNTPTNPVSSVSGCDLTFTWDAMPDAISYQVATRPAGGTWTIHPAQATTSKIFNGLAAGDYNWSVRATCPWGITGWVLPVMTATVGACKNGSSFNTISDGGYDTGISSDIVPHIPLDFVKDVNENFVSNLNIHIYPNPAKDKVIIAYNSAISEAITLSVFDLAGREVISQQQESIAGYNQIELNVSDWNEGYYLINLDNGMDRATEKLNVVKR